MHRVLHALIDITERNIALIEALNRRQDAMSAALDEVMNAVRNEQDVVKSAIALMSGLSAKIVAAANQNDTDALEQLAADIKAQTGELAAAVAQNTPADPAAPQPQPEVVPTPIDRSGVDAGPVTVTETNAAGEDTKTGTLTELPPEHASTVDNAGNKVPEAVGQDASENAVNVFDPAPVEPEPAPVVEPVPEPVVEPVVDPAPVEPDTDTDKSSKIFGKKS